MRSNLRSQLKRKLVKSNFLLIVLVGILSNGGTQKTNVPSYLKGYEKEYTENPRAAALKWFEEAKFGMFIHYGLYSLLEGYYGDTHSKPAE